MCLAIKLQEEDCEYNGVPLNEVFRKYLKKATEDITVWKVLRRNQDSELEPEIYYGSMIYEPGYLYYQDEETVEDRFTFSRVCEWMNIDKGLHSFKNREGAEKSLIDMLGEEIHEFTIPEGAYYFEGVHSCNLKVEQYVSDQLIFNEH